jgi:hypothetical protein
MILDAQKHFMQVYSFLESVGQVQPNKSLFRLCDHCSDPHTKSCKRGPQNLGTTNLVKDVYLRATLLQVPSCLAGALISFAAINFLSYTQKKKKSKLQNFHQCQ